MATTLYVVNGPIASIIKSTDASYVLLTANFNTGVVASSILNAQQTAYLTSNLQRLLAAVPVLADVEAGFAGMVESLLSVTMLEAGAFTATMAYVAPTATYTLAGLTSPSHVAVTVPHSTSSPMIGNP